MSEYIYETQGEQVIGNPKGFILPKEEIVRCRNCTYGTHFFHHDGERWQCAEPHQEGDDVKPDGYCWRGKRKEGGEIDAQAIADELNAELGGGNCSRCAEDMGRYADSLCDPLKERIAELLRCLENDWHIHASWDGLRMFWCIELTEEGVRMRDAELGSGTCEWLPVESCHTFAGPGWECSNCGHEVGEYEHDFYNCCPICCAKVVVS